MKAGFLAENNSGFLAEYYGLKDNKINILVQEIFVTLSPFPSRQKVADVKSDGLPKKKKKDSIKYTFVCPVISLQQALIVIGTRAW